jgi:tetratricopeptide (TPR) repeat protein
MGIRPVFGRRALVILAIILLAPFLVPGFGGALRSGIARSAGLLSKTSPEINSRFLLARVSLGIFRDSPVFGAGQGAVKRLEQLKLAGMPDLAGPDDYVVSSFSHDDYLQLLAEAGLAGLLLYMAFVFSVAACFESASAYMGAETLLLTAGYFSGLFFFLCESFFNFPLFSMPSSALLFAFAGIIVSESAKTPGSPVFTLRPGLLRVAIVMLLLPALLYVSDAKPGAFAADFYLKNVLSKGDRGFFEFKKALSLEPDNYYASVDYAQGLAFAGYTGDAIDNYNITLKYFPHSSDVLYNIGSLYLNDRDYRNAETYFTRALLYFPGFAPAHLGLFKAETSLGNKTEAAKQLDTAMALDPQTVNNDMAAHGVVDFKEITW